MTIVINNMIYSNTAVEPLEIYFVAVRTIGLKFH